MGSLCFNFLLTEREGRTGEYWPEVVAVRTERSEVRTKTTEGQYSPVRLELARLVSSLFYETKYFKQEPIQRRFDFSCVLYFGWPNQPSSGTMRVYIELLLCTYIYIVNGC